MSDEQEIRKINLMSLAAFIVAFGYLAYRMSSKESGGFFEHYITPAIFAGLGAILFRVRAMQVSNRNRNLREMVLEESQEGVKWYLSPVVLMPILIGWFYYEYFFSK